MKNYFLPMLLSLFFLGACDKNDEIIPEDADENFITSVVMTVDGKSYTADIATVPYKVIEQMLHHPLTDAGIEKFKADYTKVFGVNG